MMDPIDVVINLWCMNSLCNLRNNDNGIGVEVWWVGKILLNHSQMYVAANDVYNFELHYLHISYMCFASFFILGWSLCVGRTRTHGKTWRQSGRPNGIL